MKRLINFLLLAISSGVFAQFTKDYKNVCTVEGLGHANSLISFNYERIFFPKNENILMGARVGYGRWPGTQNTNGVNTIPFVFSTMYNVFKKEHFLQLGLGYSALFSEDYQDFGVQYKKFESDFSISLGYRYMSKYRTVAQIYPVFILRDNDVEKSLFSLGASVGFSF